MFERFNEDAREVVVHALDESRALGHAWIGTEHLLAGLLRVGGVATTAFECGGIDLEQVQNEIVRLIGRADTVTTGQIPFTPPAKKALERALRHALALGHAHDGILPEHIALGVLDQRCGTAARILKDTHVDIDAVIASLGLRVGDATPFRPADDAAPEMSLGGERRPFELPRSDPTFATGQGFERYTERARQVVASAQDHARALKHNWIGTEHLLLGLTAVEEALAAQVLESLGITVEEARAQVARIVGEGDEVVTGKIPFTPRARKVRELALREALSLGHNYIGAEHILLGLVRENEGVAARILVGFGADAETVRTEVMRRLSVR